MSSDEVLTQEAAPTEATETGVEVMQVSSTAIANARAGRLTATQTAIGSAAVGGDASMTTSLVGMVTAKGAATLEQGVACALVSDGDVAISQGGGAVIIGKTIDIDQGGGGVMVSGDVNASRSYVGILMARKAAFSEDSRVLFDWKAALILAVVLLGGVGVVIVLIVLLAKLLLGRAHRIVEHLPHLPSAHMPEVPPWLSAVARKIRAA